MTHKVRWTELLETAVNEPGIVSDAYSKFHNYSIGNQVLLMWQCKVTKTEPGPVAGYKRWQKLGRQVQKGERSLAIWIPIAYKKMVKDKNGDEIEENRMIFKLRNCVFTYAQTEGEEIEWPDTPEWDKSKATEVLELKEVDFTMMNGNVQGYAKYGSDGVAVSPIAENPMKTWLHEVAHELLGHTNGREVEKELREAEAEAVAMIVSDALGLEGLEESRGYIQNWWGKGREIPEPNAKKIFTVADKILKAGRK